jgi:hypothetical protein
MIPSVGDWITHPNHVTERSHVPADSPTRWAYLDPPLVGLVTETFVGRGYLYAHFPGVGHRGLALCECTVIGHDGRLLNAE